MPSPLKILLLPTGDLDPRLIRGSLLSADSASQTTSRSVQPFLHTSRQSVAILYSGRHLSSYIIAPSRGGSGPPSNRRLLNWIIRVLNPNDISIGKAVSSERERTLTFAI